MEDQILDINTFEVVKVSYEMGIGQVIFEVFSLVADIVADGEERPWIWEDLMVRIFGWSEYLRATPRYMRKDP